jgi:predicted outer membrane repeat protein
LLDGGGAVYVTDNSTYSDSANCTFTQNSAKSSGGAIALVDASNY